MACINPDGTLTKIAEAVLTTLATPKTAVQAAADAGVPLYRARATLRETGAAGLVTIVIEDRFGLTEKGLEVLELSGEQ
jgi:hypothetical protein